MKKNIFLIILIFLNVACHKKQTDSIFLELNYQPEWDKIPNISSIEKNFLETTGYNLFEQKDFCLSYTGFVNNKIKTDLALRSKYCSEALFENISYENYGKPMNCKRSDFVKTIIEEGSSWLLDRNWSDKVRNNWFWDRYIPETQTNKSLLLSGLLLPAISSNLFLMPDFIYPNDDNPVCLAFADTHELIPITEKNYQYAKTYSLIKIIEWDTNIAQNKTLTNTSAWKDRFVEVDYNNDGVKELIYNVLFIDEYNITSDISYISTYSKEINSVKDTLKQKNLDIKDIDDLDNFVEKFEGVKSLNIPCESKYYDAEMNNFFTNSNFFEFENKIYILKKDNIYLIEKNNCHIPCSFEPNNKQKLPYSIIKALAASSLTISHVHEDVYLYDESFNNEIKQRAQDAAPYSKNREIIIRQIENYLKQKVKELCGTDLDKLSGSDK
ncbi:MAG: hypothetical protein AB7U85_06820 [Alphaproteobacteria bacterium]